MMKRRIARTSEREGVQFFQNAERRASMEILIVLLMLVVLDIAAMRWGFNSIDNVDSPEWERRQRWYGFH